MSLTAGNLAAPSLDRNALRQVARLVDVGELKDCDVVGELQNRDRLAEGDDKRVAIRLREAESQLITHPSDAGGIRDHHDAPAAGHDLLDIAEGLLEEVVVGGEH